MTKYQKIYQDLLEKIKQGEIKAHTLLPSENELMKIYDASRDTVRKALNLLLNDGYIQKNKGKGSVVLDINRIAFPVSGVTSFKELKKTLHGEVKTIVTLFSEEKPDEEIQKALYVKDGLVYHVKRIRQIEGEKIILDEDYLNKSIVEGLSYQDAENSLYEYIEKKNFCRCICFGYNNLKRNVRACSITTACNCTSQTRHKFISCDRNYSCIV